MLAGVFLCFRRTIAWQIPAGFIAACAVFVFIYPRAIIEGRLPSVGYELSSGSLLFAAVFMASDPVTSPKHPLSRAVYGACCGLLCMLFRYFGNYKNAELEQAAPFAILLMNAMAQSIDIGVFRARKFLNSRREVKA